MFIYGSVGQPSHRAVYFKTYMYMQKYRKHRSTIAGHENSKKPAGGKKHGERVPPDQGSGATLQVLGYASA